MCICTTPVIHAGGFVVSMLFLFLITGGISLSLLQVLSSASAKENRDFSLGGGYVPRYLGEFNMINL